MPYWRLSSFYFFYFASLGALLPHWNPYLKSLGFNSVDIGWLMAITFVTKMVAPIVWGWIADHTGQRMIIIRLASLLGAICFAGVFLHSGFWWLAFVMFAFSFFWNASLPQFEATTMNHLGERTHRYNSIRIWGSIGFIVMAVGLGNFVELTGLGYVPIVLFILFSMIWVSSLIVPESAAGHLPMDHVPLREILRKKEVVALLLATFLLQTSHGPYYAFYSIYLEEAGYASGDIGQLWALGVIAEIVLFVFMHHLLPRYGARNLLLLAFALTTLRWVLLALFVSSMIVVILVQTLHAASFGIVHAVAIHLIHRFFRGKHQGKGQALYSSLSFGAGGAVGSLYSGYIWDGLGPVWVYLIAAAFSALALVVTWRGIHSR